MELWREILGYSLFGVAVLFSFACASLFPVVRRKTSVVSVLINLVLMGGTWGIISFAINAKLPFAVLEIFAFSIYGMKWETTKRLIIAWTSLATIAALLYLLYRPDPFSLVIAVMYAVYTRYAAHNPSETTYLRGVTCHVVQGEEASSIPKETYEEVLAPLFMLNNVTGIMISTVMESDNPYSVLLEKRHPTTNQLLFKQVRIMLACKRPACRAAPTKCWHQLHLIPPWQSLAMHIVSMTMIDSPHVASREILGIVTDQGVKVFVLPHIERAFNNVVYDLNRHGVPKFAITAVDPNNDGSSEYAIITLLITVKMCIIVGLDLIQDSGYFEQKGAFIRHIKAVREIITATSLLFLAVEANIGGHVAQQHMEWLESEGQGANTKLLMECTQQGRPGVWTDDSLKSAMTDDFQVALQQNMIGVYAGAAGRAPGKDIREVAMQLSRFTRYASKSNTPGNRVRCKISGKGPTNSLNDDGAMALLIAYAMFRAITCKTGWEKYGTRALSIPTSLPVYTPTKGIPPLQPIVLMT